MPAHSASEDARERAYVAGIHVFLPPIKTWMAGTSPAMTICASMLGSTQSRTRRRAETASDLDLLVLDHAFDGGAPDHAILERGIILELSHRQLAPHAPGVEHEAVGIDHRVFVAEPLASREPGVDLLQVPVESLEPGFLERGEGRRVRRVALGPPDVGVRGVYACGEEADH